MTSPVERITIVCPECGCTFDDWWRASVNLLLDDFDEEYLDECRSAACPSCGFSVCFDVLVVDREWIVTLRGAAMDVMDRFARRIITVRVLGRTALADGERWTCSDPRIEAFLNRLCSPEQMNFYSPCPALGMGKLAEEKLGAEVIRIDPPEEGGGCEPVEEKTRMKEDGAPVRSSRPSLP